ncbi:hypothetical protein NUACC21_31060 [Scytonema sp. NUACC21]
MRNQHEAIYGRILQASELEHRLERLEAENARLKKELETCLAQPQPPQPPQPSSLSKKSNVATALIKRSKGEMSDTIGDELDSLGIKLTRTLASKIRNSTEQIVLTAIEALKEQLQHQVIRSPGGWLVSAIDPAWLNQPLGEETHAAEEFAQWYDLAREYEIVIGSQKKDDGSMWVQENTG